MNQAIFVFLGGGAGALLRLAISHLLANEDTTKFPLGILCCNILGCFLIGCFYAWQKETTPSWMPALFVTGLLGGFTTFSSFGLESLKFIEAQAWSYLTIYLLSSVIGGLLAVIISVQLFRFLFPNTLT